MTRLVRFALAATLVCYAHVVAGQRQGNSPPLDVSGDWVGIYQVYPSYVQLTLSVPPSASAGTAPVDLRFDGYRGGNSAHLGVAQGTIVFAPDTLTLDITSQANGRVPALRFHAVYDRERGVFAGHRLNAASDASPYFILVRRSQADRFFERLADMPNGTRPGAGVPFNVGGGPSEDVLRKWASQFLAHYPGVDPYHTQLGLLFSQARYLFRDDYFRPFFGKPYDELSNRELNRINRRLSGLDAPRSNFPEEQANGAGRALAGAFFVNVSTHAAPDIMLSVLAMRSIQSWTESVPARLGALEPSVEALAAVDRTEAESVSVLIGLPPPERVAFAEVIGRQRSRLVDPVLRGLIDRQLATQTQFTSAAALTSSLGWLTRPVARPAVPPVAVGRARGAVVPAPQRLGTDIASLAAVASDTTRTELRSRLQSALNDIVQAEAARDGADARGRSAARSAPGQTVVALVEDQQIYRRLEAKYAPYASHEPVRSLFSLLVEQRSGMLQRAETTLSSALTTAKSEAQIDALLSSALAVPSDRNDGAGQRLLAAGENRRQSLRLARQRVLDGRRQAVAERERVRATRQAEVARMREVLNQKYGTYFPTIEGIYNVLALVPTIAGRAPQGDRSRFIARARDIGFTLEDADGELYADFNHFRNAHGHRITTIRNARDNENTIYAVTLEIPAAPEDVIALYAAELDASYRDMRRATYEPAVRSAQLPVRSRSYVKSGAAVYFYEVKNGPLHITALDNFDASGAIVAERLDRDAVRIDSYSRFTDIEVEAGSQIQFLATGQVTLGPFVGTATPAGVDGYEPYRRDRRFPLGSLIGQIGDGDWFLIGPGRTITATSSGTLSLRINDNEPSNNDGSFDVDCVVDGAASVPVNVRAPG